MATIATVAIVVRVVVEVRVEEMVLGVVVSVDGFGGLIGIDIAGVVEPAIPGCAAGILTMVMRVVVEVREEEMVLGGVVSSLGMVGTVEADGDNGDDGVGVLSDDEGGVDRFVEVLPKVGTRVIVIMEVTCDKLISDEPVVDASDELVVDVGDELGGRVRLFDVVTDVENPEEAVSVSKSGDEEDEISALLLLVVVMGTRVAMLVVSLISSSVDDDELIMLADVVSGAGIPRIIGPLGRVDEGDSELDATMLALPTDVDSGEVGLMLSPPKTAEGDCKLRTLVVV